MFPFSSSKNKETKLKLKISFHADCNDIGAHGTIYADHVGKGLKNEPINFAFRDVEAPPALDAKTLAYIFEQAEHHGFIPLALRSYATLFPVMPQPRTNVTETQRSAVKPYVANRNPGVPRTRSSQGQGNTNGNGTHFRTPRVVAGS